MPPGQPVGPLGESAALPACVRHPNRATALRCSRCDRPACPECLHEASVGYQCVDCVHQGQQVGRQQQTTISGARLADRSVVVPILVALNVVVFLVTVVQAHSLLNNQNASLFYQWGLWPLGARNGAWWQFFTAGFLHYGPIHILMNMVALWVIGRDLERILGPLRFTVIYLVALFGGSVSVFVFGNMLGQEAGASGAVYGLMGGMLVIVYRLKLNPGSVIGMIAVNLAISVAIPGISLLGHLGGLVTGGVLTAAMVYAPAASRKLWQVGGTVALIVVLVGLVFVRAPQIPQVQCPVQVCGQSSQ